MPKRQIIGAKTKVQNFKIKSFLWDFKPLCLYIIVSEGKEKQKTVWVDNYDCSRAAYNVRLAQQQLCLTAKTQMRLFCTYCSSCYNDKCVNCLQGLLMKNLIKWNMINPLLHTNSSSAPTSPRCTRSALENYTQKRHLASQMAAQISIRKRDGKSPARSSNPIIVPNVNVKEHRQRRLSRVVKCRTVDFTEFPEGMRDYRNGKRLLREIQSQPGSPVIPRIEIHDFGSEVINYRLYNICN